jgi:hypothetical protein
MEFFKEMNLSGKITVTTVIMRHGMAARRKLAKLSAGMCARVARPRKPPRVTAFAVMDCERALKTAMTAILMMEMDAPISVQ